HEGLIALSGCLFGEVAQKITNGDREGAKETALWYRSVFGEDNYFLEIQNHGMSEEQVVVDGCRTLSAQTGIPLAATNDVHYCTKADADMQRVLIAIGTNTVVGEDSGLGFATDEFYLKTGDEMAAAFPTCPEALANTVKIAARCNFDFTFGETKLPLFDAPIDDHRRYLRDECRRGLERLFPNGVPPEYDERLTYELGVIDAMGFNDYFLIVADFIRFARSRDIPVGPGRGSAAGSLCAYALGITGIDPLKYHLLFERFLNPERVSMPDIDIDFCYERRGEVIDYVTRKYGESRVAQIVTFGTLQAKAAVRDVARALGLPYATGDAVSRLLTRDYDNISSALEKNGELKALAERDENVRKVLDAAVRIEGMPRHASTHAAGVVITRSDVSDFVPLAKNGDQAVTQYTMTEIEQLGLLKMDFLGLRTLTVISDAEREVRRTEPDFTISAIPLDDAAVFRELSKGNTVGVFQCESAGMTNLITSMRPVCFEDIAAAIALYRPGPMFFIDTYLANRKDPSQISYRVPQLKEILDETNGCMVYQEQVMQVFRKLAGYSYGRADVVRRAMSKKKRDVMEAERRIFVDGLTDENGKVVIEGCVRRGIDAETADAVFSDMISFASYGFNKSHTVAYGMVAYQTAYLKVHYPNAFLAAMLTSVTGDEVKTAVYRGECVRLGIPVLPPHVNRSGLRFRTEGNSVVFSLLAVKNLGRHFIERIESERVSGGAFTSFWDFCRRMTGQDCNRRALESLIKVGALDGLGLNRREMLLNLEHTMEAAAAENELHAGGQLDLFTEPGGGSDEPSFLHKEEFSREDRLAFEKEVSGLYFSGHPLEEYRAVSEALGCPRSSDLIAAAQEDPARVDGREVPLVCIVTAAKKKVTKRDDIMAFVTVEDLYGSLELIVFPRLLASAGSLFTVGKILLVKGRLSVKDDEVKLLPDSVEPAPTDAPAAAAEPAQAETPSKQKRHGLFLRMNAE
ncbi:MAG: DNA polymerase III subunit alpha, partial [Clostridia bacterium]|nr:DNA polymerase III subunit alpha [Clostridia bacterium]